LERIREAIELYLEVVSEEGKPIPVDRSTFSRIDIAL
jgi:predicted RNase H-like HicB family nuclease